MGFFASGGSQKVADRRPSDKLLHRLQCRACPLDKLKDNCNPHMRPSGEDEPLIYILGQAPDEAADRKDDHRENPAGHLISSLLPTKWEERTRWNYVVRTRPPDDRKPSDVEIECLLGDTRVQSMGVIRKGYKRSYSGPVVTIRTTRGNVLSGTPNHPIFTDRGLVPLGELMVGDNLFQTSIGHESFPLRHPQRDDKPAAFDQIFDALCVNGDRTRTRCSTFNFHGDGENGYVDIVRTDGFLLDRIEAKLSKTLYQRTFSPANTTQCLLMHESALRSALNIPTMIAALDNLGFAVGAIPHFIGLATIPNNDTMIYEKPFDWISTNSYQSRQITQTSPIQIQFDQIEFTSIELNSTCHVYNLETESGAFIANNLLVSNCCRPSVIEDIVGSKPRVIFGLGETVLEWMVGAGQNIAHWRGRRMPVDVGGHLCWFYPFEDPTDILRWQDAPKTRSKGIEGERVLKFDLKRALGELDKLPKPVVHTRETVDDGIETLDGSPGDLARLEKLLRWAVKQPITGVDYETKGLRPYMKGAKILTAAAGTPTTSFSFALGHRQAKWSPRELERVEELWLKFIRSRVRKAVHFLRFELEWTAFMYGWELTRSPGWNGTESQAVVLDDRVGGRDKGGPLSLNFLVRQHFGLDLKGLSGGLDKSDLDNEPLKDVLWYNAGDAKYHCLVFIEQEKRIQASGMEHLYQEMLARVPTTVLTQLKGLPIEPMVTNELVAKYEGRIGEIQKGLSADKHAAQFADKYKRPFKPMSDTDCTKMFKDMLERREGFRGEDNYAVDEDVLEKIGLPICELIVALRKENKKLSTYMYRNDEKKGKTVIWPDGLLHPNFNTTSVRTKRTSADDPNVQNVPKRDEEAKEVRRQIRAPDGHLMVSVDYGQIQARNIAMESKDKTFVQALWDRYDVHGHWAERLARAYPSRIGGRQYLTDKKVMKAFRNDPIKSGWTFSLFFGGQLKGVSEYCEIPEHVLKPELKQFQRDFAGVFEWHERLRKFYETHGYVEDSFGFRHNAPLSFNQIINSPIQSLEALFVCRGWNNLSRLAVETGDYYYQPNAMIHDDLTFVSPIKRVEKYVETYVTEMLNVDFPFLNVPITLEASIGEDLMHMEEVLVASSDDWKK